MKNSKAKLKNEDVTAQNEFTTLSDKNVATYNSVLLSIQSRIQFSTLCSNKTAPSQRDNFIGVSSSV